MRDNIQKLFPKIESTLESLLPETISNQRKESLDPLASYIREKIKTKASIQLNFICTHNSRRSHLSQVWAQAIAYHFGIKNIHCYSGGTEATALYPMAAEALKKSGFRIHKISESDNPIYRIKYAENAHPVIGFSKTYDDGFNPRSNFGAILTCDSANEACPIVQGADARFPITFEDPKKFDNTPQQEEKYLERSLQIANELYYVFKATI